MEISFGEALKRLRMKQGLSQQQLGEAIHIDRSSISNWEADRRIPDLNTIKQLAGCLNVNVNELVTTNMTYSKGINIIMVDDEKIILDGNIDILRDFFPNATFNGFTTARSALVYAENNKVDLAFLDIELGSMNGIELCRRLLDLNPRTNIIYLTGYSDYAIDAWATGASGFLLKPLDGEKVKQPIGMLRYPVGGAV